MANLPTGLEAEMYPLSLAIALGLCATSSKIGHFLDSQVFLPNKLVFLAISIPLSCSNPRTRAASRAKEKLSLDKLTEPLKSSKSGLF